jgi:DNA adenine methylase
MNGPLKWHGGKHYLAQKIVSRMPQHTHYVEPYAGGLAVLLAKPCLGSEVVNDLNQDLTNFWRVLQDEELFTLFQRRVEAIPFSEIEWRDAKQPKESSQDAQNGRLENVALVERAARFFVVCRQSLSGRCQDFAPLTRNRIRRGMNEQVSAWLNAVEGLPVVHARLKRVVVLNRPGLEVIWAQDGPETLFYLDPPYVPKTRSDPDTWGELEMTEAEHQELLDAIQNLQGRVMLSGYRCPLYDSQLAGWTRHEFKVPNNAAGGLVKRRVVEALWCNFENEKVTRKGAA